MITTELLGLRIRSEIPLPGAESVDVAADLTIRWGDGAIPPKPEAHEDVLASFVWGGDQGYTHTRAGADYILRFHHLCAMRIDADLRVLHVHLDPGGDGAMVPLLVGGNALAFVLTAAGACVLHASAVQPNGSAIAFVGSTGMGKSTLAALLCAAGARLVTDDSLRLAPDAAGFRCYHGSHEIRLRSHAAELASRFAGVATAATPDGRVAIQLGEGDKETPRLGAVVVPLPERGRSTLDLRRLAPTAAFLALSRYPRIAGITAPDLLATQFQTVAQVARSVPVYEARIPWGPPFASGLAEDLIEAVA